MIEILDSFSPLVAGLGELVDCYNVGKNLTYKVQALNGSEYHGDCFLVYPNRIKLLDVQ